MTPKCCRDKDSLAKLDDTAKSLKVIADKNRLKILCLLQAGERCVCDIWKFLDLPQNLTSHHLKVLRDAGLIDSRKEGLNVHYSIDKKAMSKFNSSLREYLQAYGE